MSEKKPLTGLTRDNPATPEGKYLVKRRDGTIPEWPHFVLGAADPLTKGGLIGYAIEGERILREEPELAKQLGLTQQYLARIRLMAHEWVEYRKTHPLGDPGMGPHRKDDPATIEEMKKGQSA